MLLIYSVYACFFSNKVLTSSPAHGGWVLDFSSGSNNAYLVNNNTSILFIAFVEMLLTAFRLSYSLSASGSLFSLCGIGRLADGRCGLLTFSFAEERNEYTEKEIVRRTG